MDTLVEVEVEAVYTICSRMSLVPVAVDVDDRTGTYIYIGSYFYF